MPVETPRRTEPSPDDEPLARNSRTEEPAPARRPPAAPPLHRIAVGGRVGPTSMGAGASGRVWRDDRIGGQLVLAHADLTSGAIGEHLTSTLIEPSVLYKFRNRTGEHLWMRPYVGSGLHLRHETLQHPFFGDTLSQTKLGLQMFGGAEFAVPTAPRFVISSDLGYHWTKDPVPAYDLAGVSLSLSVHWYVK